jgi:hypothetical protein
VTAEKSLHFWDENFPYDSSTIPPVFTLLCVLGELSLGIALMDFIAF